ncbi:MAG: hypothetical protein QOD47_178 [Gemmatimonadaceae bacterium]|jgi:hypothetical protein|nr:hypothetical protein [Gemmatimonadaceae bacterium]
MRWTRSASAAGAAALGIALLTSPSAAQDGSGQRAPRIRVYSQSGAIASSYVTPAIEVSEDAYVFAVSFDLDGQIQILHPDFPGISVRMLKDRELRLPNFFAGLSRNEYDASGRYVSSSDYAGGDSDSRGTVIALASRVPFNLERVENGGDWNISAIRRVIERRSPASAARALAVYLGVRGQPIGTDYMRFAPDQSNGYYASGPAYSCSQYYGGNGGGVAFRRLAVLNKVAQLQQGGRSVRVVGYDFCGMPIVAYGSSQPNGTYRPRSLERPADENGPRGHGHRSHSGESTESFPTAGLGTFPLTGGTETQQMGDVLIAPLPRPNRRDPREIFADPRIEGRPIRSAELNGSLSERSEQHRAETTAIGTLPAREYPRPIVRQAPMVQAPRPAPAPAPARH